MNHEDRQIHENLQILAKRCERPRNATPEQIRRWIHIAGQPKHARILRFVDIFRRHPIAGLMSSGTAAAILIFAIFGGVGLVSQSISADEVFAQVGNTVSRSSAVCVTVKDVVFFGHRIDMLLYDADNGEVMYGELKAKPLENASRPHTEINMAMAMKDDTGWFMVRSFSFGGCPIFGDVITANDGILVSLSAPSRTYRTARKHLPSIVNLTNVSTFIESLRKAVPELIVRELPSGLVALEGIITKPELLDPRALRSAVDVNNTAGKMIFPTTSRKDDPNAKERIKMIAAVAKMALENKLKGEELEIAKRRIDILTGTTTQPTRPASDKKIVKKQWVREGQAEAAVQTLVNNSSVKITYDSKEKLLRSVHLTDVGPNKGSISIRFDVSQFNRKLLNVNRHKADPNVLLMTRDEFMQVVLMPLLMPPTPDEDDDNDDDEKEE